VVVGVAAAGGDSTSQPVVLFNVRAGLGFGLVVAVVGILGLGGGGEGDFLLACLRGGGEVGDEDGGSMIGD
jgi:hypothetical protein